MTAPVTTERSAAVRSSAPGLQWPPRAFRLAIRRAIGTAGALGPVELMEALELRGISFGGPPRQLRYGEFMIARRLPQQLAETVAALVNDGSLEVRLRPVSADPSAHRARSYAVAEFTLAGEPRFPVTPTVPPIPHVRWLAGELARVPLLAGWR